jgi:hypothetical protein
LLAAPKLWIAAVLDVVGDGEVFGEDAVLGGWRRTSDPARVDVSLAGPGSVTVQIGAWGFLEGTSVTVSAVPYQGGGKITQTQNVANCDPSNGANCVVTASFDLAAGGYVIEAKTSP